MIKKIIVLSILICGLWIACSGPVFAQDEIKEAEEKAKEAHAILEEIRAMPDVVSPDSIYTTTELQALYYQNIQIIDLLRQIRNILQMQAAKP